MPRKKRTECTNQKQGEARHKGPFGRDSGLCRRCAAQRLSEGGRAGGKVGGLMRGKAKRDAGRKGGRAGKGESKARMGIQNGNTSLDQDRHATWRVIDVPFEVFAELLELLHHNRLAKKSKPSNNLCEGSFGTAYCKDEGWGSVLQGWKDSVLNGKRWIAAIEGLCEKWRTEFPDEVDKAPLKHLLMAGRDMLKMTDTNFQFLTCEEGKLLKFCVHLSSRYRRDPLARWKYKAAPEPRVLQWRRTPTDAVVEESDSESDM